MAAPLAYTIAGKVLGEPLTEGDLIAFARAIGIKARGKTGETKVRTIAQETLIDVARKIDGFNGGSMKVLGDMIAHQIERIGNAFAMQIQLPGRDAFALRGGG